MALLGRKKQPDHPPVDKKLLDAITQMRVQTCVDLREAHGKEYAAYKDCLTLLEDVCNPGKDMVMDGDHHETPTGLGFCKAFFEKVRQQAEQSARKCADIAKTKGPNSEEYKECLPFMEKLCVPGDDMLMDGDKKENSTGDGYCQIFFPKPAAAGAAPAPAAAAPAAAPPAAAAPAPAAAPEAKAAAISGGGEQKLEGGAGAAGAGAGAGAAGAARAAGAGAVGGAGAAGVAGAPAPAAALAPSPAGWGSPAGAPGGAPAGNPRYHMSERKGLPAQGYEGEKVEHNDMKTQVDDWRKEYGPDHPQYEELEKICDRYPGNEWCRKYGPKPQSPSPPPAGSESSKDSVKDTVKDFTKDLTKDFPKVPEFIHYLGGAATRSQAFTAVASKSLAGVVALATLSALQLP